MPLSIRPSFALPSSLCLGVCLCMSEYVCVCIHKPHNHTMAENQQVTHLKVSLLAGRLVGREKQPLQNNNVKVLPASLMVTTATRTWLVL